MNTSECSLLELKCQDRHLCILSEFGELIEKVFGVLTYQLEEMRDLMLHHHVVEVSMESTNVYSTSQAKCIALLAILRLHVFPKVYRANDVCN